MALVNDSLQELVYDARIASSEYSLQSTIEGVCLTVSGYSDKSGVLVEAILKRIHGLDIDPSRFDVIHERVSPLIICMCAFWFFN